MSPGRRPIHPRPRPDQSSAPTAAIKKPKITSIFPSSPMASLISVMERNGTRPAQLQPIITGFISPFRQLPFGATLENLIGEDADEHHRAHNGKIQRAGYAQQIHQVLQYLKQGRPDDNPDN